MFGESIQIESVKITYNLRVVSTEAEYAISVASEGWKVGEKGFTEDDSQGRGTGEGRWGEGGRGDPRTNWDGSVA